MIAGIDDLLRRSEPVSRIRVVIPGVDDPVLIYRFREIAAGLHRTDLDHVQVDIRLIFGNLFTVAVHGDIDQIL